ncbi:MAG: hypothetical protein OXC41_04090 [Gammaproteobacteria bacterium]|nr:hypothetical protein [Gammaproteobacteria bacterium]
MQLEFSPKNYRWKVTSQVVLITIALLVIWTLTHFFGGGMIDNGEDVFTHKLDMLIFTLSGIFSVLLAIWVITLPLVRRFLHLDILITLENKWRKSTKWQLQDNEPGAVNPYQLTAEDIGIGKAAAISSGLKVAGTLIAIAEVATPLG